MAIRARTVLFFSDNSWPKLLVSNLRIYKNSFTCWVINGAYYFKWKDGIACACDVNYNYKTDKEVADWNNPVTVMENVPYPSFVEINFNGGDNYYDEIIIEATKKFNDPENYIDLELTTKNDLTHLDGYDTVPF